MCTRSFYFHSTHAQFQVSAEFCKILLHMDDGGAIPGFPLHRHAAMTALGVASPVPVSNRADPAASDFVRRSLENLRTACDPAVLPCMPVSQDQTTTVLFF